MTDVPPLMESASFRVHAHCTWPFLSKYLVLVTVGHFFLRKQRLPLALRMGFEKRNEERMKQGIHQDRCIGVAHAMPACIGFPLVFSEETSCASSHFL